MACEAAAAAVKTAIAQLSALAMPTAAPSAPSPDAPATGADNGIAPASAVDGASANDDEFTPATCRRAAAVATTASAAFAQVTSPPFTTHRQHPFSHHFPPVRATYALIIISRAQLAKSAGSGSQAVLARLGALGTCEDLAAAMDT